MPEVLYLTTTQRGEMLAHIKACLPEEAVGLAAGVDGQVEKLFLATNALHSPVRFRMEPKEQVAALKWIYTNNLELVAIFHSHPSGPALPSETDIAEFEYPDSAMLIWSPAGGSWEAKAFMVEGGDTLEIPIRWGNV
jgi:proteasome lid subunit RPN8/RPN11